MRRKITAAIAIAAFAFATLAGMTSAHTCSTETLGCERLLGSAYPTLVVAKRYYTHNQYGGHYAYQTVISHHWYTRCWVG